MNKKSHKDVESEGRVHVVGCVGYETLWELVDCNGDDGLEANGEEGVGGDVVVVLLVVVVFWFGRVGAAGGDAGCVGGVGGVGVGVGVRLLVGMAMVVVVVIVERGTGMGAADVMAVVVGAGHRLNVVFGDGRGDGLDRGVPGQCRAAVNVLKAFLSTGVRVSEAGPVFVAVWFRVLEEGHYSLREEGGSSRLGGSAGVDAGEVGDDLPPGLGVAVYHWSLYVCVSFGG